MGELICDRQQFCRYSLFLTLFTEQCATEIFARMHPALVKTLDVREILPHLNQTGLTTERESESLSNAYVSTEDKINKLVSWIPRKGPDSLEKFVTCLRASSIGTGHLTLAKEMEALTCHKSQNPYDYTLSHAIGQ